MRRGGGEEGEEGRCGEGTAPTGRLRAGERRLTTGRGPDRTADCAASGRGGLDGGAAVVGLGRGPASRARGAERRRGMRPPVERLSPPDPSAPGRESREAIWRRVSLLCVVGRRVHRGHRTRTVGTMRTLVSFHVCCLCGKVSFSPAHSTHRVRGFTHKIIARLGGRGARVVREARVCVIAREFSQPANLQQGNTGRLVPLPLAPALPRRS